MNPWILFSSYDEINREQDPKTETKMPFGYGDNDMKTFTVSNLKQVYHIIRADAHLQWPDGTWQLVMAELEALMAS